MVDVCLINVSCTFHTEIGIWKLSISNISNLRYMKSMEKCDSSFKMKGIVKKRWGEGGRREGGGREGGRR